VRKLIVSLAAATPAVAQPQNPTHAPAHVVASGSCNGSCHLT